MTSTYTYRINGTAAGGQTWETSGSIEALPGQFPAVCNQALSESFDKLTQGNAVFGFPGLGCQGPYVLTRLLIEVATAP
jgi:hypothetical protein